MVHSPFEELDYFYDYNKEVKRGIRLKDEPRSNVNILSDLYSYGYWMGAARRNSDEITSHTRILPYIHTPYTFIEDQLNCIERYSGPLSGDVLTFNIDYAYFLVEVSKYSLSDINVHLYTDDREVYRWSQKHPVTVHYDPEPKHDLMRCMYNVGKFTFEDGRKKDKFKYTPKMKFDYVIGNPPYQKETGASTNQPIWHEFVEKSFEITKSNGYISLVHPSGWRTKRNKFEKHGDLILSNNIVYLNLNTREDGIATFDATTSFDWYVVQKKQVKKTSTEIEFVDNTILKNEDLSNVRFIPNRRFEDLRGLIAHEKADRVNFIHSWNAYESVVKRNDHMSENKTGKFIHPVIYTITQNSGVNLKWSSTNERGHFGIPKVIWSNGSSYPIVDKDGKYGICQFAYGIHDHPDVLSKIKEAMESDEFLDIMDACKTLGHTYDRRVISLLKKDFWKEFV